MIGEAEVARYISDALKRYSSVREVECVSMPLDPRAFFVRYVLVTGERGEVRVPFAVIDRGDSGELVRLVTKDLGALP